ncbi:hypothetical protein [Flavobacterium sp. ALJ2]|uniref:hypothetical protein n=1 Tax=Flavobacterium sp. ALJ2 TaxID=2786960 RepID=UPI00293D9C70|nr:hypothetical protein [Flavobacterium sp. ALJ2]
MKKFLILILIYSVQNITSQTIKEDSKTEIPSNELLKSQEVKGPDYIYNTAGIEVKPEFPGGLIGLDSFIKQNYKNPTDNLKGKVYMTFIIEKRWFIKCYQSFKRYWLWNWC